MIFGGGRLPKWDTQEAVPDRSPGVRTLVALAQEGDQASCTGCLFLILDEKVWLPEGSPGTRSPLMNGGSDSTVGRSGPDGTVTCPRVPEIRVRMRYMNSDMMGSDGRDNILFRAVLGSLILRVSMGMGDPRLTN